MNEVANGETPGGGRLAATANLGVMRRMNESALLNLI